MFMLKQDKLNMVKRSIRQAYNPKRHPSKGTMDDFKGARAFCKKYVKPNQFGQYIYKNYGITYETIAKEIGCSKQTAVEVINFALKHHWVHKFTRKDVDYIPGVGFQPIEGYTYTTMNYAVKVYANQYKLNSRWYKLLMALQPTFTRKMSRDAVDEYYEKRKLKQNQMRERFRDAVNELAEQYGVDSDFVWKIKGSIDKKRTTLNMIFSLGYPAPLAPTCVANIESKK